MYDVKNTVRLDDFCSANGWSYYVKIANPTEIEFVAGSQHVYINMPGGSVTVPANGIMDNPYRTLELLAYVARKYDAFETISHINRSNRTKRKK